MEKEARESAMELGLLSRREEIKVFVRTQSPSRKVRSRRRISLPFFTASSEVQVEGRGRVDDDSLGLRFDCQLRVI